ncbi:MAG: MBL fold metallo-hydrolase [Patescibacteria group bacterium]|jgi:L-ascorbate metabolism protein UlaG (beta-lactamase superfamily)
MQISYLGLSSFRIKTNTATIVTDPYAFSTGLHFPKTIADITIISQDKEEHNNKEGIKNPNCFFVEGPGEYEIKEVMIRGMRTFVDNSNESLREKNTIYTITAEDLVVCHLGDLNSELSDKLLKEMENVDVLMIPVGGLHTLNPEKAVQVIKKIDSRIVIPMHYSQPGLSDKYKGLATLEQFLQEFELEPKRTDKLVLSSTSLPDEMELMVLDRKK